MIDLREWEQECDMVKRGQTLRFNHTECEAGADNRRRLYLTRPASSPGVVLAYCHNCQDHGILRDDSDQYKDFERKLESTHDKVVPFQEPTSLVNAEPELWPTEAHHWRIDKHLRLKQCMGSGIKYDPDTHRIYLPMYDKLSKEGLCYTDTELLGYQLRGLSRGPKYLTALKDKETKPSTRIGDGNRCTYLVEDLASGLNLAENLPSDCSVVVNYGVKCNPEVLDRYKHHNYAVVWLDNDGDHIEDQALTISRTWELLTGKPCYVEDQYGDPKLVDKQAVEAIDNFWKRKNYG